MTDDEITKSVIKIISDVKKSKTAFHTIIDKTILPLGKKDENFTVIRADELARLKEIEKRFFDISYIARTMYDYLRRKK